MIYFRDRIYTGSQSEEGSALLAKNTPVTCIGWNLEKSVVLLKGG